MRSRAAILTVAVALVAVSGFAGSATAAFETGLASTAEFTSADPAERDFWFDRTVELHAGVVRIDVAWAGVASAEPANPDDPGDPAYDFSGLDAAVTEAASRDQRVLLTFYNAPDYAQEGEDPHGASGVWKPRPEALGRFARAVATRYSGSYQSLPRVRDFEVWNEPNLELFLAPQYEGGDLVSFVRYRDMVNAVARNVHAVSRTNRVVVGGLGPYGDEPGGSRSRPVTFLRRLFCLDLDLERRRCPTRTHVDVLSHHPINQSGPPRQSAFHPNDASSPDLPRISKVLRAAERAGTIAGARRHHPIWATEFWWNDVLAAPDAPNVTPAKQARWVAESLYLFWKAGAKVAIYLPMRDSSAFHAGLFETDADAKPSATAFAFPFVTDRRRGGRLRAWGKSPAEGELVIERRAHDEWKPVGRFHVAEGQVFVRNLAVRGAARLRAEVAGKRSLVWVQR